MASPSILATTMPEYSHNISDPSQPFAQPATTLEVTKIVRRTDLSLLYRALRVLMRPLRPRLVSFPPPLPVGSPQVTKRPHTQYGVSIKERETYVQARPGLPLTQADGAKHSKPSNSQHLYLYEFEPPRNIAREGSKKDLRHTIYYFCGGGFQSYGSGEHWKLCARLAKDLADDGIRVIYVSYPVGPNSPAKDSLPLLRNWLLLALEEASADARRDEHITLMGDSSGANIVLTLSFWWSEQLELAKKDFDNLAHLEALQRLKRVLVMSPPCDLRNVNPEIHEADKIDPVLNIALTTGAADTWSKGWPSGNGVPKGDPILSPLLHDSKAWQTLRESNLRLDGIYGTADCLAPDCKLFMERCEKENIPGEWLVWERQMHCFPLTVCYGLSEGNEGFEWIKTRMRAIV